MEKLTADRRPLFDGRTVRVAPAELVASFSSDAPGIFAYLAKIQPLRYDVGTTPSPEPALIWVP